jgi:hypothetical protein
MSFAEGFVRGFVGQAVDNKIAADAEYADMVREAGKSFKDLSNLFIKEEKDIENRFNTIQAKHGTPMALYASYEGLTKTDYGTELALNASKEFVNSLENIDFQGYDYSTAKTSRLMNFNKQNEDTINTLVKNQGAKAVGDLFLKTSEVAKPELDLPAMSKFDDTSSVSAKEMRDYRKAAFTEFQGLERDQFSKRIKDGFKQGYDLEKHGPSEDLYAFERYFNEFYLPRVVGVKADTSMKTQMEGVTGAQQTGETLTFNMDNVFSFNGKLYNVPDEFKGQSIPEITKKSLASQQDKEAPTKNNPNVISAQEKINIIRSTNPNDPRIEDIKRDLRIILGVTNLEGLIT